MLAILITQVSVTAFSTAAEKLNLVIITSDDNDVEALGCYGCPLREITPNIDRLAKQAVRFTEAYTTSPTCQPSRLSLMTGRHPQTNGNTGHVDPLKPGVETLAVSLKQAGYFTAIVGKEANYLPGEAFDWDRHNLTADTWAPASEYWSMWRSPEGFYQGTRELIGAAESSGKPFFLHLNTSDPHRPWPGNVDELWHLAQFERQWKKRPSPLEPFRTPYSPWEAPVPAYLADLPGVRVDLAQYYSAMRRADRAVGQILKALDEAAATDSTIVIYLADQGAPFPMSKQSLYRVGTRIPLIIKWPGITNPSGVIDSTMISIIDVMPTLLEGLGLPEVREMDGRSFLQLLKGASDRHRDRVFTSYNYALPGVQVFPMRAVQTREFLYIYNAWHGEKNPIGGAALRYDGLIDPLMGHCWKSMKEGAATDEELATRVEFIKNRVPEEFYDLSKDPDCRVNLIGNTEYSTQVVQLRQTVEDQMRKTGDPLLAKLEGTGPIPVEWFELPER